jgi:hypothetical protein
MQKFAKEILIGLIYGDHEDDMGVVSDEISFTSRWSIHHEMIFKVNASWPEHPQPRFYRTTYSVGATESQDEQPYEYDGDDIECQEVEPYEELVIKYREKK